MASTSSPPDLLSGEDDRRENTNYVAMEMAQMPPAKENVDDDEDQSLAESIVSSVLTQEGIHDFPGFLCVCFVILIGDMSRGVMFPSMWPLVETLGGTTMHLGCAVAAFSFGRILVNPVFGTWSHQIGYSKTLKISCSILLLGTLIYAQVQNVGRPEFLIVAQTILGIGSGTLGVTRAFVADVTAKRQRTTYMAWITAVQYGGFTVTPFFGALFNRIFGDSDYQWGPFRMNMFTAPAYFMTMVVGLCLFVLHRSFQDRQRIETVKEVKKSNRRQAIDDVANTITFVGLSVYDCCILGCMLLNVSTKGGISVYETLGIVVAEDHFGLPASRAGVIVATCGSLGVISLLSMGHLARYLNDIQMICGGMAVMLLGVVSLVPMEGDANNPTWQYVVAIFMIYAVGYPIGHTAVIGLFSKSTCSLDCRVWIVVVSHRI